MARKIIQLSQEEIQRIETMAGLGLNVEQIALIMKTPKRTLERRLVETEGAQDAIERGRAVAVSQVTKTLFQMAVSGKEPSATYFYLKCRARWKETSTVEHTGKDGNPIDFVSIVDSMQKNDKKTKSE
jgi:hypothetical protein